MENEENKTNLLLAKRKKTKQKRAKNNRKKVSETGNVVAESR